MTFFMNPASENHRYGSNRIRISNPEGHVGHVLSVRYLSFIRNSVADPEPVLFGRSRCKAPTPH